MHMPCWLDRPKGRPVHNTLCGWFYWSLILVFGGLWITKLSKSKMLRTRILQPFRASLASSLKISAARSLQIIWSYLHLCRHWTSSKWKKHNSDCVWIIIWTTFLYETCPQCYCECRCHSCRRLLPHGSDPFQQGEPGVMVYPWVWFKYVHNKRSDKVWFFSPQQYRWWQSQPPQRSLRAICQTAW